MTDEFEAFKKAMTAAGWPMDKIEKTWREYMVNRSPFQEAPSLAPWLEAAQRTSGVDDQVWRFTRKSYQ